MAKWFKKANKDLERVVAEVLKKYHSQLLKLGDSDVKTTVDTLLVYSDTGPALRVRGATARGCIRITGAIERTQGIGDALMLLDGEWVDHATPTQLRALIDHELEHVVLKPEKKTGKPYRLDDIGRPVLGLKPHDHEFGWFDIVARRWGDDSGEVEQARQLIQSAQWMQKLLPGFDDDETAAA